ncbi:Progestin and adipoQ receptor family member 3 [Varanus komodoensis]|nr:Progestin and adipoQ receptor family member 3 [Varanus komodoensis]
MVRGGLRRLHRRQRRRLGLFILSNETVNIWSHLLGFFLFFTLGIYDMTSVLPSASASREDFVICSVCLFCFQYWRQVYLITVLALILAVFFAQIHPSYLTQQWHRLRSVIFCSVSGYGIIPTMHWVWLNGGVSASIVQEFAPRVIVMYLIAGIAFLFYISKVPERYFPELRYCTEVVTMNVHLLRILFTGVGILAGIPKTIE